jgi:hypothetical protein
VWLAAFLAGWMDGASSDKKRTPLYLQAIVLDGFSDFDDETRGVVEAVGRFEQVRTGVRLERDVGPDGRRRNRRRRRRPRLGRRPTRATLCKTNAKCKIQIKMGEMKKKKKKSSAPRNKTKEAAEWRNQLVGLSSSNRPAPLRWSVGRCCCSSAYLGRG